MANTKRQYYAPDIDAFSIGQTMAEWLSGMKYQTQTIPYGDTGITVQARKEDALRTLTGMSSALTISIYPEAGNLSVEMGNAKWLDKGAVAAVGVLIFWPALVTAGIGAYQQNQVQSQAWQQIETYLHNHSAYGNQVALGPTPNMGAQNLGTPNMGMSGMGTPGVPAPFAPSMSPGGAPRPIGTIQPGSPPPPLDLSNLSAPASSSTGICPQCKQAVRPGAKFCDACGAPVGQKANVCSSCGKPLRAGARFCDECGTPIR